MKMDVMYLLLISLIITIQSCNKMDDCDDDNFTFSRQENTSDTLRLNGYYFGDISETNPDNPNIYVLNQNGIFLNRNSFSLNDAQSGNVELEVSSQQVQNKGFWGVYKISGRQIEIQSWIPMSNGCVSVLTEKGIITSDTTFKITSWQSSRNNEVKNINAKFSFAPFSPKPDSIVSFIP